MKIPTQDCLLDQLKLLFPLERIILKKLHIISYLFFNTLEIQVNARESSHFQYKPGGPYLELDVWLPTFKIGIEFQVI